jgi:acetyl esterase/lipase
MRNSGGVPAVPIGYLLAATFVACCAWLAVAPLRRPRRLGLLSWRLGLVPNELPFYAFYWLLASTLLAFAEGDLDSAGGWLAFGVAVLASTALVVIVGRALRAGRVIDHALTDGLGADWRRALDPDIAARLRNHLPWTRILLVPWFVRRRDVERVADISYGDVGAQNQLDVYRHRSHPSGGPTLVYLHGGGFVSGRKDREARPLIYRLASQGWVCISANYRLGPAAGFPDHLVDVKKVIAWVRSHGHEYGADPTVVFVAGSSAGGHLAAMAALSANDPAFQPGFETVDTSVAAAICLYGYYGRLNSDEQMPSSPQAYVRADAPPFFVAHGDQDTYVPVESARHFTDRLRQVSKKPVVYVELPGAQHSFDLFHSIRFETLIDGIEAFATWVRSRDRFTGGVAHRSESATSDHVERLPAARPDASAG